MDVTSRVCVLPASAGKGRITPEGTFDDGQVAVATIFAIEAAPAAAILATRLSPCDAAVAILRQMSRLDRRNRARLERELPFASVPPVSVPVFRLAFPRNGNPRAVAADGRAQMQAPAATVART